MEPYASKNPPHCIAASLFSFFSPKKRSFVGQACLKRSCGKSFSLAKTGKLGVFFLLFFLFFFVSCQAFYRLKNPVSMEGESPEFLNYQDVFLVYYDPRIPKERLLATLKSGYKEWKFLVQNFFPNASGEIYVIIYKDRASYNRQAKDLPKSLARFDRRTNRIYLVQGSSKKAWRHELVHAILDGIRPADYRVQEGLAWFLQSQDISGKINCKEVPRSKPLPFQSYLPRLRREVPSIDAFFSGHRRPLTDVPFLARSAYYMEFLWSQKKLKKSINYYVKHPHSQFEYEATRGDYIRLKKLYKEFNKWLRSSAPLRGSHGC